MIRSPFAPKEKRVIWYYIGTVLVSAVISWIDSVDVDANSWRLEIDLVTLAFYSNCLILAYFVSVVYACRKLRGPGISKAVREQVMKRHILTIGFFIFANLYEIIGIYASFYADFRNQQVKYDQWYYRTLKILFAFQGYFNPILRVSEPCFYQIIASKIKNSLCSRSQITKQQAALQAKEDQRFVNRASKFVNRTFSNIRQLNGLDESIFTQQSSNESFLGLTKSTSTYSKRDLT